MQSVYTGAAVFDKIYSPMRVALTKNPDRTNFSGISHIIEGFSSSGWIERLRGLEVFGSAENREKCRLLSQTEDMRPLEFEDLITPQKYMPKYYGVSDLKYADLITPEGYYPAQP